MDRSGKRRERAGVQSMDSLLGKSSEGEGVPGASRKDASVANNHMS